MLIAYLVAIINDKTSIGESPLATCLKVGVKYKCGQILVASIEFKHQLVAMWEPGDRYIMLTVSEYNPPDWFSRPGTGGGDALKVQEDTSAGFALEQIPFRRSSTPE